MAKSSFTDNKNIPQRGACHVTGQLSAVACGRFGRRARRTWSKRRKSCGRRFPCERKCPFCPCGSFLSHRSMGRPPPFARISAEPPNRLPAPVKPQVILCKRNGRIQHPHALDHSPTTGLQDCIGQNAPMQRRTQPLRRSCSETVVVFRSNGHPRPGTQQDFSPASLRSSFLRALPPSDDAYYTIFSV